MEKGGYLDSRGLSQVVSTVLIILISIMAIGMLTVFVFNVIKQQNIEEAQTALNCITDVDVKILSACYTGNLLKIKIKNEKDIILGDFFLIDIFYFDREKETIPTPYYTIVNAYESRDLIVPYLSPIEKIKVIPRIESTAFLCYDNAPEYSNIKECSK